MDKAVTDAADTGGDEELRLVPADASPWDRAIQKQLEAEKRTGSTFNPVEMDEPPVRFSVRDVLVLTTFAAVLFALFRLVQADVFALMLGTMAFISLVAMSILQPRKSILQVGWWVLLAVYLITAVAAVVRG